MVLQSSPPIKVARSGRPGLLRQVNERAVFEFLQNHGNASRTDLKAHLGMSATTASKAVAQLIRAGFVEDIGHDDKRSVGRPSRLYRVTTDPASVLGIAVDIRQCHIVSAGLNGHIDTDLTEAFDTPSTYEELLTELEARVLDRLENNPRTLGIGLSLPGEVDADGQVLYCPNLHILDGRNPAADLTARLHVTVEPIHETLGVCLAEHTHGAGRGMQHFVLLTAHEGFGASVISGGQPVAGHRGIGCELGHITVEANGHQCGCGNRGCLETVATDLALVRRVNRDHQADWDFETIMALHQKGELDIQPQLQTTLDGIAIGVAAAINMFNPEAVLVSARLFDAADDAIDRLIAATVKRALPPLFDQCKILRVDGDIRQGAVAGIVRHLTHTLGPAFDVA